MKTIFDFLPFRHYSIMDGKMEQRLIGERICLFIMSIYLLPDPRQQRIAFPAIVG
jgi:hypothetical protein